MIRTNGTYFVEVEELIRLLESMCRPLFKEPPAGRPAELSEMLSGPILTSLAGPRPADPQITISPPPLGSIQTRESLSKIVLVRLDKIEIGAKFLGFKRTQSRILHIREYLGSSATRTRVDAWADEAMSHEIRVLGEAYRDDLEEQPIFLANPGRIAWFQHEQPFDRRVYDAFPGMRKDITAAGSCYATDNATACVFHLTRVIEQAIRALAKHLHVSGLKHEIDYEDWKTVSTAINTKLTALGILNGASAASGN